jgi:hypothetical protein
MTFENAFCHKSNLNFRYFYIVISECLLHLSINLLLLFVLHETTDKLSEPKQKAFKELECILQGKLITARLIFFPSDFKGSCAIFKDIPS